MSAVGGMIYLDNNATTQIDPVVLDAVTTALREGWANPSASYRGGRKNARALRVARAMLEAKLQAEENSIFFTSGGTESNNAVIESARARWPARKRLIIGATEHPSITEPTRRWERDGGYVTRVRVHSLGVIDLDHLKEALSKNDTALVSIMWANNETGVIAPMQQIAAIAQDHGAFVHTDAVQSVGKLDVNLAEVPVNYLSLSAHKFHGPKGVGALYVRKGTPFHPLIVGGDQESGMRSGTENLPGVVGMSFALDQGWDHREVKLMRDTFEQRVIDATGALLNGHPTQRLDNTSSLTFPGLDAAGLLIMLDERGVCCSAGSACHSAALHPSHVLEAMGFDADYATSTLRFSFSRFNTMDEANTAADIVIEVVAKLRELTSGGPVIVS